MTHHFLLSHPILILYYTTSSGQKLLFALHLEYGFMIYNNESHFLKQPEIKEPRHAR